jgi:hypothetical protein
LLTREGAIARRSWVRIKSAENRAAWAGHPKWNYCRHSEMQGRVHNVRGEHGLGGQRQDENEKEICNRVFARVATLVVKQIRD